MNLNPDSNTLAPVIPDFFLSAADVAHANFANAAHSTEIYETAETVFLETPADTADAIIRKLALAESYIDDTDCGSPGDIDAVRLVMARVIILITRFLITPGDIDAVRLVMALVSKCELDAALRYARAIVAGDGDDFCYAPIRAAIADLEVHP